VAIQAIYRSHEKARLREREALELRRVPPIWHGS
jgi:hypothetical protein